MEVWKQIGDTRYSVSNLGRVRNDKRGNILSNCLDSYGYPVVKLGQDAKVVKVHKLVAEAFLPPPADNMVIDHINRIKHDNRLENLRWATPSQNACNTDANLNKSYIKFVVCIHRHKKKFYGSFDSLQEAEEFRNKILKDYPVF